MPVKIRQGGAWVDVSGDSGSSTSSNGITVRDDGIVTPFGSGVGIITTINFVGTSVKAVGNNTGIATVTVGPFSCPRTNVTNIIDCSLSNYFTTTVNSNTSFTVTNVPTNIGYGFTLELSIPVPAIVTWFPGVLWSNDAPPALISNKVHLLMFFTDDGGSNWRGSYLLNYIN